MLNLGIRPGECYALDYNDINIENKKIHIRTSLTHSENGNIIIWDRTKTYSGDRFIDIDRDTETILKEILNENINNKYNLLFWDKTNNSFMSVPSSNSSFKRFCKKYKIGKEFEETQYVLRHSYTTRKIESGMPAEVLKSLLGHKDIEVTLNTYFDAFAEYKNKYNKISEDYIKEQKLNYLELSQEECILIELEKINKILNVSSLDDLDKKILYEALNKIKNKYSLLEEKTY